MSSPVFHLEPMGRLANLMIEYMVALRFADLVPGCRISNIDIPAWGIHHAPVNAPDLIPPGRVAIERREQHIDLVNLAHQMLAGEISRVEWTGFGQRIENFLPAERYQDVFVSPFSVPMGYGPDDLVCPVRAEDILHGPHPDYVLTPVQFYRDIADGTGLRPVFIGQTHPNAYMDQLRSAFPDAFIRAPQDDPLVDFETIRQSRNVVIGVSTYSWLAAWLSRSADSIFMTVNGLFNPMQTPNVDLVPFGDRRFKFCLFPINYATSLDRYADVHRRIAPYWRQMPHQALQQQFAAAPRFERRLDDAIGLFDEAFYLATNADVAAAAQNLGPGFARAHYMNHGFQERRLPARFDSVWYASHYPMAAFEVAQGDFADFTHHYAVIGRARGYRPFPQETE